MGIQCDSQHRMELALFLSATTGMGVARNAGAVVVDLAVDPPPHTLQPQSSADAVALPGLGQLRRRIECGDSGAEPSLIITFACNGRPNLAAYTAEILSDTTLGNAA